jgi:hypothetical protein
MLKNAAAQHREPKAPKKRRANRRSDDISGSGRML